MKNAALSIKVFGTYLVWLGVILLTGTNLLKSFLQIPDLPNVWLRFIGLLLFCLGLYYLTAARNGWVQFFKASVGLRLLIVAFVVVHVILGALPVIFLPMSMLDLIGAIWTFVAVRGMKPLSYEDKLSLHSLHK